MWRHLIFIDLFILILTGNYGLVSSAPKLDPGNHVATDHSLVIRSSEGQTLLMGTQSENQFRAETRDANNEVKGVYSWLDALGNEHTTAFNSGKDGYRTMPLEKSGIELPPFPYGLYGDRPKEIQARTLTKPADCVEPGSIFCDDMVVIGLEEDIIAKQDSDATSTIATKEAPIVEDTEVLQITEATPIESSTPRESADTGHGQIAVDGAHSVTSAGLQYDIKLPQFNSIQEKTQVARRPKVFMFPLVANYYPYGGYPIHYPLRTLATQPQFLRPQPLQPLYILFSKKKHK